MWKIYIVFLFQLQFLFFLGLRKKIIFLEVLFGLLCFSPVWTLFRTTFQKFSDFFFKIEPGWYRGIRAKGDHLDHVESSCSTKFLKKISVRQSVFRTSYHVQVLFTSKFFRSPLPLRRLFFLSDPNFHSDFERTFNSSSEVYPWAQPGLLSLV